MKMTRSLVAVSTLLLLHNASALSLHSKQEQPTVAISNAIKVPVTTGTMRCTDSNVGSGFIMYTQQPVNERWDEDTTQDDFRKHTAKNFLCVRYNDNKWEYDNNWADEDDRASRVSWHVFIPRPTDTLVAVMDFGGDKISNLNGTFRHPNFKGMVVGYAGGDLNFFPNQNYSALEDVGEVRMNGTYFIPFQGMVGGQTTPTTTLPPPTMKNGWLRLAVKSGGISCTDSNAGAGFIMYTQTPVNERWDLDKTENDFRVHTATNFVCVRYKDNTWQYDTNWEDEKERLSTVSWHVFMPVSTDILVASVDFTADKVMDLKASNMSYKGVASGYKDGDLVFFPDQTSDGKVDDGEFRIAGSYITPFPKEPVNTTTTTTTSSMGPTTTPIYLQPPPNLTQVKLVQRYLRKGEFRCTDDNIFPGFIMYSREDVHLRFVDHNKMPTMNPQAKAKNAICVRFKKDRWQYDTNARDDKALKLFGHSWVDFAPRPDDVAIAAVDFVHNKVQSLKGMRARSYGMQFGYQSGSVLISDKSMGDYQISGKFVSWGHPH